MQATAIAAARAAGEVQLRHYGGRLNVDEAQRHDLKLEVDRLCEKIVIDTIRAAFPDHSILSEECGADEREGEYRWIVDPLDGTVNFFYGLPYFCASVACYRRADISASYPRGLEALGEPVAGAIYAPRLEELFAGAPGAGATLNGRPLKASRIADLKEALVATGFGSTEENIRRMAGSSCALVREVRKVRCLGSAGLDLANVAAGRLTGFHERGLRTWDFAAARILIEAAGGRIHAVEYEPDTWEVTAAGPNLLAGLKKVLGVE